MVDRDNALYQGALRVEWRAVPAPEDARQPVNDLVLLSAATMIAERSRAKALDLNREGKFQDAKEFLRKTALALRELAPRLEAVERLARELEQESEEFAAAMAPAELKQRHFASYAASMSRSVEGKARRRPRT
jgi:hypothetical protein